MIAFIIKIMENRKKSRTGSSKFYFAYGSNMDEGQMADRCPNATLIGKAVLNNYRFVINSRGVATAIPVEGRRVYGLVWHITRDCESSLDEWEGVRYETYRTEEVTIIGAKEQNIVSLIYVARDSQPGAPRIGYLERIICAAQKNSFAEDYIQELREWKGHT